MQHIAVLFHCASIFTLASVLGMRSPAGIYQNFKGTVHTEHILLNPLPIAYVYDHCPFCVRVRLALGLKGVKHELRFLANDDVKTPTMLANKKLTPIFELPGRISAMTESMDIIRLMDSQPIFGAVHTFRPASNRTDIFAWQAKVASMNRIIQRPRYLMTSLPEFAHFASKNAFVTNHPLEPFSMVDWKSLTDKERWQKYDDAYQTSSSLLGECNKSLQELEEIIFCSDYCTEGGLSYDDIDLWSRLRSVTLVKGIVWPQKLRSYMDNLSFKGDVPLYDTMSI